MRSPLMICIGYPARVSDLPILVLSCKEEERSRRSDASSFCIASLAVAIPTQIKKQKLLLRRSHHRQQI